VISPYVVAAIGARQARQLFLTAEIFDAAEAHRIGLVHRCVPAAQLDMRVDETLALLRNGGPIAQNEAKKLVARIAATSDLSSAGVDADNAALIARLRVSAEGQEGIGAFLSKRKGQWNG
jgi:methylglutaconyl-CoA hydratase